MSLHKGKLTNRLMIRKQGPETNPQINEDLIHHTVLLTINGEHKLKKKISRENMLSEFKKENSNITRWKQIYISRCVKDLSI